MIGKITRRTKKENIIKTSVSNFKTDEMVVTKAKSLNKGLSNCTIDAARAKFLSKKTYDAKEGNLCIRYPIVS